MTKLWALRKRAQFAAVYKLGGGYGNRLVSVRALPNGLNVNRYGFSVSKSLGKAVVRNRVRRLLREIVRQKPLRNGWDIILTPRAGAAVANYQQLNESVSRLMLQAGLLNDLNEAPSVEAN